MKLSHLLVAPALLLGVAMPAHAVSINIQRNAPLVIDPTHDLLQDFDGATTDPQGAGVTASPISPNVNVNSPGLPNIVDQNLIAGVGRRPGHVPGTPSLIINPFPGLSTGNYLAIGAGESYTLNFASALRSIAFALGSFDNSYRVSLTHQDSSVTNFAGAAIAGSPANWGAFSNAYVRYDQDAAPFKAITSITFSSITGGSTFEIDNIYGAVPEPAMWAMLIGGFGMAGVALRKRRPVVTA